MINETYRRNDKANGEKHNKEDMVINCNSFEQVEEHLPDEYLNPILDFKDKIVKAHGKALIVWIHGISDENIEKQRKACLEKTVLTGVTKDTLKMHKPCHMLLGSKRQSKPSGKIDLDWV